MNDEQIKYMRDRFLGWAIPVEGFHPDGGISFEPLGSKGTRHEFKREPSGTNVFNAEQAEQMIRFMLDGCNAKKPMEKDVEEAIQFVQRHLEMPENAKFAEFWGDILEPIIRACQERK
jgi:hypothetical protein